MKFVKWLRSGTILVLAICCFGGGVYLGSVFSHSESSSTRVSRQNAYNHGRLRSEDTSILVNSDHGSITLSTSTNTNTSVIVSNSMIEGSSTKGHLRKGESKHPSKDDEMSAVVQQLQQQHPVLSRDVQEYIALIEPTHLTTSFHASDSAFLQLDANLDSQDLLVAAYVRLDCISTGTMRTIFSNKYSGCAVSEEHVGISLFVNDWQTNDEKLYVEYGDQSSGCHKINTGITVTCGKWYHVAVHTSRDRVTVYLNGAAVTTQQLQATSLRAVQTKNKFIVGRYHISEYPLMGNISRIAFASPSLQDSGSSAGSSMSSIGAVVRQVMDVDHWRDTQGLKAYFPLTHNGEAKSSSVLDALSGAARGEYRRSRAGEEILEVAREVNGLNKNNKETTSSSSSSSTERAASDEIARGRREAIKRSMSFVWGSYKKYAWGRDELKPHSRTGSDNWGGMGVTLVDSLDTLWLMGLRQEFDEARQWVATQLSFDHAGSVSVFETTIRELGGLLSAFDLSGDRVFLEKATQLADRLMPAFNSPSGIACSTVNMRGGGGCSNGAAILSEMGTLQVEFRYLSFHTKNPSYEKQAMRGLQVLSHVPAQDGLYPIKVSVSNGQFADSHITFGALGDSFYEYLLKTWVQGGRREQWLRDMYDRAMDGMVKRLLKSSTPSNLVFVSDWNGRGNDLKMDHLVCFLPATLALGAITDPGGSDSPRARRDLDIAKSLAYTCREMYHRTASGLSPEYVTFNGNDFSVPGNAPFYILRPETAESLFYLHQITGDPTYREWAWEIFEAINKHCRTEIAFAALRNVNNPGAGTDDRMESFFLAETMKYLYLIQDPENSIDLTKYVFNTEAHPLKIFDDSHVPVEQ